MTSDDVDTSFISFANFCVENKREARKAVTRVPAAIRQWRKEQVDYFQVQTPHSNVRQMPGGGTAIYGLYRYVPL